MMTKGNRGMGVLLVLVLVILLIIFFSGMGQTIFSSQVINHTQRASLGLTCQYLATSACEEAHFQIQEKVNKPGEKLFEDFRSKVYGKGPAPFTIDFGGMPHISKVLDDLPQGAGYAIESITGEVLFRRQLVNMTYETYGLIKIQAKTSASLIRNVQRTVTTYRDFKVALISPPRPFGKAAIFLGSAEGVVPWGQPNAQMKNSYLAIRRIWVYIDEAIKAAEKEGAEDSDIAPLKEAKEKIEKEAAQFLVGKTGSCTSPYDWKKNPQPLKESEKGPHYFGDAAVKGDAEIQSPDELILVVPPTDNFDLADLDLLNKVKPLEEARSKANEAFDKATKEFSDNPPDDKSEAEQKLREIEKLAIAAIKENKKVLEAYYDFQVLMSEKTGKSRETWLKGFVYKKLTLPAWKEKAFYTATSLDDFKMLRETKPLSGIVYMDTTEELDLSDMKHEGKLIVVIPGDVKLSDVGASDKSIDQLTFVCFGNVRLSGTITASIILGVSEGEPKKLETSDGLQIDGNLISGGPLNFNPGELKGTLKYDKTLDSGNTGNNENKNHHFVAISPTLRFKSVSRQ